MEEERINLSQRERDRLRVLHELEQGHLQQREAARRLRLSARQIRRLEARLEQEGDRGLVHRLRGRTSNCKIPEDLQLAKKRTFLLCVDTNDTNAQSCLYYLSSI